MTVLRDAVVLFLIAAIALTIATVLPAAARSGIPPWTCHCTDEPVPYVPPVTVAP